MYMFKVGANAQIQYTVTEMPAAADPTAPGVFVPVEWTALIDCTDAGDGTLVRTTGGYGTGGAAVGSIMSGATTAAVKASLRFTLHAADGEIKCGVNFDRNTLPDDASLKLAIHVNPGQGVWALGSAYGYPFSDFVPLVEGGSAQLDILQDGSATFSINGTAFAARPAGTLPTDGLYADGWVYTPEARISEVQALFANPTPKEL